MSDRAALALATERLPGRGTPDQAMRHLTTEPFYLPVGDEIAVFSACHARGLPVMLK